MSTNLYGLGDSYHAENSHVIPALIRRFHIAKGNKSSEVTIWGTIKPVREFLYVDDMVAASVYVMNLDKSTYLEHTETRQSHINVGFGGDVTIFELAHEVCKVVGYQGQIVFDLTKPVGPPQKLLNSSLLNSLGWHAKTELKDELVNAMLTFVKLC
jgi:GDP-L-fucose synthase